MSKTDELNKLFVDWKTRKLLFCEDGILSETDYEKADIKVLFVLKDVHNAPVNDVQDAQSEDGKNIDMRKALRENGEKDEKTWKPLIKWLSWLIHVDTDTYKYLAFMNLKKDEGWKSVSAATLEQYAERDQDLIREQIRIIAPDVIIACSRDVFEILRDTVFKDKESSAPAFPKTHLDYGQTFIIRYGDKPTVVVNYHHPTAREKNSYSDEQHKQNMESIREFVWRSKQQ